MTQSRCRHHLRPKRSHVLFCQLQQRRVDPLAAAPATTLHAAPQPRRICCCASRYRPVYWIALSAWAAVSEPWALPSPSLVKPNSIRAVVANDTAATRMPSSYLHRVARPRRRLVQIRARRFAIEHSQHATRSQAEPSWRRVHLHVVPERFHQVCRGLQTESGDRGGVRTEVARSPRATTTGHLLAPCSRGGAGQHAST